MVRTRTAPPPSPTHIFEDSSSLITQEEFGLFWDATPSGYLVRPPQLDEPDPSQVNDGYLGIHYASFEIGLRFPLPEFARNWLRTHEIVPAQLHPNGWAQLIGFTILCFRQDVLPTASSSVAFIVYASLIRSEVYTHFRRWLAQNYFRIFRAKFLNSRPVG